jgi:hypothetical protein
VDTRAIQQLSKHKGLKARWTDWENVTVTCCLLARKGRRAGQPVQPREISFTAARRTAITTTRSGAATASLPGALTAARRAGALCDLGRRRVVIDRDRHRDHKTKTRQAFPAAGRGTATRKAPATITVCDPVAA